MNIIAVWKFLYWCWVASEVAILAFTRTRRSSDGVNRNLDRGSLFVLWATILLSISAAFWIGDISPHNVFRGAPWLGPLSLAFLVLGLFIRWTAILTLGKFFTANVSIHTTQTIHKSGLFRFVRHPSYTGMLLIFVAIGLATRNWAAFGIVTIFPLLALLYRIHVEEAALTAAFGSDYLGYSRTTKRLIPGVY